MYMFLLRLCFMVAVIEGALKETTRKKRHNHEWSWSYDQPMASPHQHDGYSYDAPTPSNNQHHGYSYEAPTPSNNQHHGYSYEAPMPSNNQHHGYSYEAPMPSNNQHHGYSYEAPMPSNNQHHGYSYEAPMPSNNQHHEYSSMPSNNQHHGYSYEAPMPSNNQHDGYSYESPTASNNQGDGYNYPYEAPSVSLHHGDDGYDYSYKPPMESHNHGDEWNYPNEPPMAPHNHGDKWNYPDEPPKESHDLFQQNDRYPYDAPSPSVNQGDGLNNNYPYEPPTTPPNQNDRYSLGAPSPPPSQNDRYSLNAPVPSPNQAEALIFPNEPPTTSPALNDRSVDGPTPRPSPNVNIDIRQENGTNLLSTTLPPNPCLDPPPVKPNFTAPGRRISAKKCYEYIWELKNRIDLAENLNRCLDYQRKYLGQRFVIGGRITKNGEFPHMGAIGWSSLTNTWLFNCGSTIISPKFVITAGHCTIASPRDTRIADLVPKIIRFGVKNLSDKNEFPTDVRISRIIPHPQYASPKPYYDVALMEVARRLTFTKGLQPACLWARNDDSFGNLATVTGWGVIKAGSKNTSDELQAGDVPIINSIECDNLIRPSSNRHYNGIKDHQLCAGRLQGGIDACQGDSGGPLQVKIPLPENITSREGSMHYIIGVTSFGVGCAHPNLPGVYTRVSSFLDWIENIVWVNQ